MKKTFKGLSAILMTSVLAVSASAAAIPAFAEGSSIKISSEATGTHTYKAYQLLKGTVSSDGTALGNITFGDNLSGLSTDLIKALKGDKVFGEGDENIFKSMTTTTTANDFATAISNLTTDAQKQEFAKIIGRYVENAGTTVSSTATPVDDGYYIIKDIADIPDGQTRTLNMLQVEGAVEIKTKEKLPTSDKAVDDKNDSDASPELNQTGQKSADYDIGDDIPYTLTFTLPENYAQYSKYPITFYDDMCAGLTLNTDSAKIWYGDVTGEGTTIEFASTTSPASTTGGTMYKYEIADLKSSNKTFTSGTITIKYTAKLNDNAVIGGAGNINKYKVAYANDPNWVPPSVTPNTPDNPDTPDTPENPLYPDNPPTSETPEKKNAVFTYDLVINKVDEKNAALKGADFTLYKWIPSATGTDEYNSAKGTWTPINRKDGTSAGSTFTFNGLDDGIYKLSETTTPKGYNTIEDKIFTISADHTVDAVTKLEATGGLAIDGDEANGLLTAEIKNQKGVTLPGTGGVGTTIFYIIGGLMISGALVLLIVKKRMSIKEK